MARSVREPASAACAWVAPVPATTTARTAVPKSVTLERIWILLAVGEENPCDPPSRPACPPRGAMAPAARPHIVVLQKHAEVQERATTLMFRGRAAPRDPP